jgi:hypothetical protein
VSGGALAGGECEVGLGQGGPAGFVLDADRVTAGVYGFDQGGADACQRVEHEIAGTGVGGDRAGGDGGQHPGGVGGRPGDVAAAAFTGATRT